jgi:hypothetical protein
MTARSAWYAEVALLVPQAGPIEPGSALLGQRSAEQVTEACLNGPVVLSEWREHG